MRAARTDANQPEIVQALRKCGAAVTPLHRVGDGVADLLVSFRGQWLLMEVKTDDGTLTPDQVKWHGQQKAAVHIVRSPLEAIHVLNLDLHIK